jgi:hypothetical protein
MNDAPGASEPSDEASKPIIIDYTPTDNVRAAVAALGIDPDAEPYELSEGVRPGYIWKIRKLRGLLVPLPDSTDSPDSPDEYSQTDVGGTEGDLELAFKDTLDALGDDASQPEQVEHRLSGSVEAFRGAMGE